MGRTKGSKNKIKAGAKVMRITIADFERLIAGFPKTTEIFVDERYSVLLESQNAQKEVDVDKPSIQEIKF